MLVHASCSGDRAELLLCSAPSLLLSCFSSLRERREAPLRGRAGARVYTVVAMNSGPRKLHYVSASYLAAFTPEQTRQGRLHVLDVTTGKPRPSTPNNEAHERDLFRLEPPAPDPLALEDWFAMVEDRAAPVLAALRSTGVLPVGEDRKWLIVFMAIHVLRVPGHTDIIEEGTHEVLSKVAWYLAEDPEQRRLIEDDAFRFEFDQNTRLDLMLKPVPMIASALSRRSWSVLVAASGAPDFATSDHPVTSAYEQRWKGRVPLAQVGMGGTEVTFPIGPRHALIGTWQAEVRPFVEVGAEVIGEVNRRTLWRASRWLYSAAPDVIVRANGGGLTTAREHLAAVPHRNNAKPVQD